MHAGGLIGRMMLCSSVQRRQNNGKDGAILPSEAADMLVDAFFERSWKLFPGPSRSIGRRIEESKNGLQQDLPGISHPSSQSLFVVGAPGGREDHLPLRSQSSQGTAVSLLARGRLETSLNRKWTVHQNGCDALFRAVPFHLQVAMTKLPCSLEVCRNFVQHEPSEM